MQFIENGPDIPNRLMHAHEEGRVVFFCGAGISFPAGLPSFKGLVADIYTGLATTPKDFEIEALRRGQLDTALGLLEQRYPGGRDKIRQEAARILTPKDLTKARTTATHRALLILSRNRDGKHRLVTTNFDRIFEMVLPAGSKIARSTAPQLPVPKQRWSGIVYLHGSIPEKPVAGDLDALVLSSGDFGLAYLTEGWAARFVAELVRNYVVCFVGYSINDPVLRYMVDALAADRLLGETPSEVFAFGGYSKGKEKEQMIEWSAKHVTPILYKAHSNHFYLHKTLQSWADHYRDGILGNERLIIRHASSLPSASTKEDDIIGRVLWAISDPSGVPAKIFADLNPAPPFEWLGRLAEERFGYGDLKRFGIHPKDKEDATLRFSLLSRYASYDSGRSMTLVSDPGAASVWDKVIYQLARWTLRHLNDPRLFLWFAAHGGVVEKRLASMILEALRLSGSGVAPAMRALWTILLAGRVR